MGEIASEMVGEMAERRTEEATGERRTEEVTREWRTEEMAGAWKMGVIR